MLKNSERIERIKLITGISILVSIYNLNNNLEGFSENFYLDVLKKGPNRILTALSPLPLNAKRTAFRLKEILKNFNKKDKDGNFIFIMNLDEAQLFWARLYF